MRVVVVLAASALFLGPGPSHACAQSAARDPEQVLSAAAANGFSGFALIVRDGKTAFARGYGRANPVGNVGFAETTPISIASITKNFTKAAILRLEQDGRLSTADAIGKYVPELPPDKRGITVQQLLDMRGGLAEYHERPNDSLPADHQRMSRSEALERISTAPLLFPPGTDRRYSNPGYTLLAMIVEAASGMPYERYVHTALLAPAGMTSSGFYGEGKWAPGSASRAAGQPVYLDNAPDRWPAVSWVLEGSGGMISTPADLRRWVEALRSGKILGPTELKKQYTNDEFAFYAGGNSIGFETSIVELDGGRDIVILHTNSGLGRSGFLGELAAWAYQKPIPQGLAEIFAQINGQQGGRGVARVLGPSQGPPGRGATPGAAADPVRTAAQAFMRAMRSGAEVDIKAFINEWLSNAAKAEMTVEARSASLGEMSKLIQSAALLNVAPAGPSSAEVSIDGADGAKSVITIEVETTPAARIARITLRKP